METCVLNQNTSQSNSIQVTTDRESNRPSAVSRTPKPDGIYRGTSISVKKINRESVDIFESSIYAELKQILYVRHDNINPFVGVCVDAPNVCVAMVHAEKGSLQDVLADPQFEWQFHMSLAIDIAMGMEYLHSTPVETHGHLTSANCVIDERWVCKITDYGLKLFRGIDKLQRRLSDLLWTAPEILHKKEGDPDRVHGTKPGDVYSFGIIVSELLTGQLPYHESLQHGNVKELLAKVKLALEPPFRPTLPSMEEHVSDEWIDLAKHCWQTTALKRPTFKAIRAKLTDTYSGKFTNVFERTQMILEESLERASEELMVEKRKTENMLRNFVPSSLLQAIGRGQQVEPQLVKAVTLCQCDTTGLYKATSQLSAELVVDVLKSLYQKYDEIIANYGAHEVSTWGSKDSMMLAGGLPLNSTTNTQGICAMSVDLLNVIARFSQPLVKANTLKIKISIHAGPAYTSVIGTEIPQFCVYGEAVQATTNLHAFAKEMAIRISKPARNLLPRNSVIKVVEAGEVKFKKGKPLMTYFITGRRQSSVTRRKSPVGRKSSSPKGAKLRPSVASKKSKSSTTNN